ncbi:MAG TPA: hypothetical protein VHK63_01190, partial [Candidatus Limnocylindria bacterium]|nr:hypothetical protein [Candidatus Limnocylindria bacterium]
MAEGALASSPPPLAADLLRVRFGFSPAGASVGASGWGSASAFFVVRRRRAGFFSSSPGSAVEAGSVAAGSDAA